MRNWRGTPGGAERLPEALGLSIAPSVAWLWARRLCTALCLAFALGYLPYRFYLRTGLSQYLLLKAELLQIRAGNQKLLKDNRHLRMELDLLSGDDHAIERVARDELGLIRTKELVFKVEETQP